MNAPRHILVLRFSALGDVAMTVPVLKLLLQQYPDLKITFVSAPFLFPLVEGIERLRFYPADTKGQFKGINGLYKLSRELNATISYDAIADLHDVLRTKLLRFFLGNKPTAIIDKGRKEKKELTRPVNKKLRPLRSTFQRYADVFEKLGLPVTLDVKGGLLHPSLYSDLLPGDNNNHFLVGIAPFAKHLPKMYPLDQMKEVVKLLSQQSSIRILLFGSAAEADLLQEWEEEIPHVYSLAGKMELYDELNVIAQLNVMVSMDSANMHLASLFGVPVVSVWGGTHPFLGFYGWGQPMENAIQVDLACRPSSVFGKNNCPVHGQQGCMNGITPRMIYDRVIAYSAQ